MAGAFTFAAVYWTATAVALWRIGAAQSRRSR
jgi:hypothetical protein